SEIMDISVKTIEIDRRGKEGLICRDNIRADIKVTFFVRVNKTRDDVVKVAQSIGCARASDPKTLEELFSAKFSEALKTVGKQLDFVDLYTKRDEFRDRIVEVIGRDLNGYVLEDAAIDYLEQTPLNSLDSHNILDAQGIRKITELTTIEHIRTNEYTNNGKKQIKKQDVEAAEAILELERQQADATAKQKREIETVIAREQAEIQKVQAEERLKSELARIKSEEEIAINEQNKQRQVEVAQKNRERVVVVETERVKREQAVEAIAREREVELQRIAKEKDLEEQRKAIAEVTCERIAVDKTVAEQEEVIKALRVVEEAKRIREAAVITAEGEAQEKLIKDLKAAEGAEMASKFKVKEKLAFAEAEYEIADKQAKARLRMAEGVQAEAAAVGLAQVKVKDAE
ncbi:MAG TPA: flotillin family protein, partial [Acidobacteriota bacterium]|nr:flotillin family protein [Acidobacteriota bacterium]